jgi:GcrA cell cycle regulator
LKKATPAEIEEIANTAYGDNDATGANAATALKPRQCRWPIGDPQSKDFKFCVARSPEAEVYCEDHASIAMRGAYPKKAG